MRARARCSHRDTPGRQGLGLGSGSGSGSGSGDSRGSAGCGVRGAGCGCGVRGAGCSSRRTFPAASQQLSESSRGWPATTRPDAGTPRSRVVAAIAPPGRTSRRSGEPPMGWPPMRKWRRSGAPSALARPLSTHTSHASGPVAIGARGCNHTYQCTRGRGPIDAALCSAASTARTLPRLSERSAVVPREACRRPQRVRHIAVTVAATAAAAAAAVCHRLCGLAAPPRGIEECAPRVPHHAHRHADATPAAAAAATATAAARHVFLEPRLVRIQVWAEASVGAGLQALCVRHRWAGVSSPLTLGSGWGKGYQQQEALASPPPFFQLLGVAPRDARRRHTSSGCLQSLARARASAAAAMPRSEPPAAAAPAAARCRHRPSRGCRAARG